VREVVRDGPADRAGLRRNDIITHIDGRELTGRDRIPVIVATKPPGQTITSRVWRPNPSGEGGSEIEFEVTLDRYDFVERSRVVTNTLQNFGLLDLETATPQRAASFGARFQRGAIVQRVRPGSDADRLLEPGSIILAVDDLPILNLDDLYVRIERLMISDITPIGPGFRTSVVLTAQLPGGGVRRVRVRR